MKKKNKFKKLSPITKRIVKRQLADMKKISASILDLQRWIPEIKDLFIPEYYMEWINLSKFLDEIETRLRFSIKEHAKIIKSGKCKI